MAGINLDPETKKKVTTNTDSAQSTWQVWWNGRLSWNIHEGLLEGTDGNITANKVRDEKPKETTAYLKFQVWTALERKDGYTIMNYLINP